MRTDDFRLCLNASKWSKFINRCYSDCNRNEEKRWYWSTSEGILCEMLKWFLDNYVFSSLNRLNSLMFDISNLKSRTLCDINICLQWKRWFYSNWWLDFFFWKFRRNKLPSDLMSTDDLWWLLYTITRWSNHKARFNRKSAWS